MVRRVDEAALVVWETEAGFPAAGLDWRQTRTTRTSLIATPPAPLAPGAEVAGFVRRDNERIPLHLRSAALQSGLKRPSRAP